jgi:tetratricopeptide (TPR) repeat protein
VYELNAPEMLGEIDSQLSYPLSVITQSWLFFKYAWLWLFPNPAWMSVDMREPFALSLLSPYLLAAGCFVVWGAGALWLLLQRGQKGLVGFALLFPWLMFFTEFSSVRIQEVFVLYRSYLWAVGAFCLLPVVFSKVNARVASLILATIALAMLPISMERLMTFSHPVLLWDDAEKLVKGRENLPGVYRIYYNRGTDLIKIGELDRGMDDLKHAIALGKDFAEAHCNLGVGYFKKGDWGNAVSSFSTAIEISQKSGIPPRPRYFYGRAQAFENIGDMQKAQADYQISCQLAHKGCEKLPKKNLSLQK